MEKINRLEPGKIKLDTRGRRTPMTEDIKEMLEQNRMIIELNTKILELMAHPQHTVQVKDFLRDAVDEL